MSTTDPRLLALLDEPLVVALRSAAVDTPCHLVGGAIRDRLLDIGGSDLDAVVGGDGLAISRRLADALPARLVHLGGTAFAAYRLVGKSFTLDLWDRQEQSLRQDLARRDFTVNAIAVDVASGQLADPFDGQADLHRRLLRATTSEVFVDDPLRVLRLVRLALQLRGFNAAPSTVDLARQAAAGLVAVAAERVRDELGKVLRAVRFPAGLELLADLDLYPGLLLGRPGEAGDASAALGLVRRLEPALAQQAALPRLPHGRLGLAGPRLAMLFAGLTMASDLTTQTVEACRQTGYLTGREAALCRQLLACRQVPGDEPAARWFLHRWGESWPAAAAVLAALADPPPGDWQRLFRVLEALAAQDGSSIFTPSPLLDGDQIRALLGVPPGPRIGAAVASLRRAQVEGRVSDRAAAEALIRSSASGAG